MSNPIALRYSFAILGAMLLVVLSHQMPHGYVFLTFFPLLILLSYGSGLSRMPVDLASFASLAIVARLLMPAVRPQGGLSLQEVFAALIATWLTAVIVRKLNNNHKEENYPALKAAPAEKNDTLTELVKHAAEGVLVVDGSGKIIMVNTAAERQFGYEPGELTGNAIEIVVPRWVSDQNQYYDAQLEEGVYAKPICEHRKVHGVTKSGNEFTAELSMNTLSTPHGLIVMGVIVDFRISDSFGGEFTL